MAVQVERYYARWSPTNHHGYIIIYWDGGAKAFPESSFSSPAEFQVVVDLLRNEEPVWWDEPTQRLYASNEPVGEGEPGSQIHPTEKLSTPNLEEGRKLPGQPGQCGFVAIQREAVNIGGSASNVSWKKAFRIPGLGRPLQGFLIFNVHHLTHKEVPVKINGEEIGKIRPLGSWEHFQEGWFTQIISIRSGILRGGNNDIYIEAIPLPDEYGEEEYDDLDLKEVICFFQ